MTAINITYLNGRDIERIALTDSEILAAVEQALVASGRGETVIEPRSHLIPDKTFNGHFNILRGYVAPLGFAGVKVVGDFHDNYKSGLPSEMAILNLFDPRTGMPRAILDATAITDMRTGALTAIGAKHLARADSRILGHVGARGTSYWNIRLLDRLFNFAEIRVHSRRPESRNAFAQRLSADLGKTVVATEDWESCFANADILVEASRLDQPAPLLKSSWVKPGALIIPYGTMSALELDLTDQMDKIVVDDRGQMLAGPFGALRPHINAGKVSPETVYAEIGEICAGLKPGRVSDDETILFWHRGLATSDIALGAAILEKAEKLNIGTSLVYR
ncbi:MAG TPA: ornithine cyclodeaminase family protein [Aestuariivirga sp.]|nr:ornithine cyclodeaminase family protein [Aestuariivirga sp.]